jgi:hypothetical protein
VVIVPTCAGRSSLGLHLRLAAAACCLLVSSAAAQEPPDLSGAWQLDQAASEDIAAKIKDAAGSASMSGGLSWATETWIPWGGGFKEGQRVELREVLLAAVPAMQTLQIEQGAQEVKTVHGEAGVRLFYLTRASAGTSALSGSKVERRARWQGSQLMLESKGKDSRFQEVLSLGSEGSRLTYALRLEHKLMKAPLEVTLVYRRAAP